MINFAVIGIGRMGSIHAENLASGLVKDARLVAVCDTDVDKLKEFSKKHPEILTFGNHTKMFESIKLDAVLVATPHYSHVGIVIHALNVGINVLSEKPQSVAISEAQKANEVAKANSNLLYGIVYNQRTNPVYVRAKEIIASGALGGIRRVTMIITDWYRSQFYYDQGGWRTSWSGEGGGLLINQCVHQLDILQWLTGMPKSISATCKTVNRNITVENDVTATFEYENGASGTFIASGHELYGTNRLEIAGDNGKIVIDDMELTFIKYDKSEFEVNANVSEGYGATGAVYEHLKYEGEWRERDERYGQQLRVVEAFTDVLMSRRASPVAYGYEGINALSIINGIYLSAYGGKKVNLPLDANEYDIMLQKLVEGERK
ncbi:MAG: Gfo/Idh/MocA family oxidoreductase [Clostridia bacterium]|nr:Gfo/Idh/MocA family oxidoreductase [Clostridia bacterium]